MEYVILGFLMIRALSQYDIMKALDREVSPFYQSSLGSIQNGLKKLLEKKWIEVEAVRGEGRRKNIYQINDEGSRAFVDWMLSEFSDRKFDAQLGTRLFFLGHLNKLERQRIIKNALSQLEGRLASYKKEEASIDLDHLPKEHKQIGEYQIKTLELAIHQDQALDSWLRSLLAEEEYNA